MKFYKMLLIATVLGLIMATLYILGLIPAYIAILIGFIGGLLIYKIFK